MKKIFCITLILVIMCFGQIRSWHTKNSTTATLFEIENIADTTEATEIISIHSAQTPVIQGIVVAIDDYIVFETEDGNGWVIDYEDGFSIGDNVIIIYSDMGTPDDIYDDEIIEINIKY